jgi:hypothetical protein
VGPAATRGLPTDDQVAVRPGDSSSAAEVEGWLSDYAAARDPRLRDAWSGSSNGTLRHTSWGPRPSAAHPPPWELADPLQVTTEEVLEEL